MWMGLRGKTEMESGEKEGEHQVWRQVHQFVVKQEGCGNFPHEPLSKMRKRLTP